MMHRRQRWVISGMLVLGVIGITKGLRADGQAAVDSAPPLEQPTAAGDAVPNPPLPNGDDNATQHEAFVEPGSTEVRVRAPKAPPAPIVERPSGVRISPDAVWVGGYWSWDPASNDFGWVSGAWKVPPGGMIWVPGRWVRDDQGWSRSVGTWSPRRGQVQAQAWRVNGPPAEHPEDVPGPAPGPDAFFVPGHYAPTPTGDRLIWTAGFWASEQPGWDWVPARWIRKQDGWAFRSGYWAQDRGLVDDRRLIEPLPRVDVKVDIDPKVNVTGLPPAIIESEPAPANPRDPIADKEGAAVAVDPLPPPVVVAPAPYLVRRYPYYNVYGPRPYDPLGVVPPFARRIIDRVIP